MMTKQEVKKKVEGVTHKLHANEFVFMLCNLSPSKVGQEEAFTASGRYRLLII